MKRGDFIFVYGTLRPGHGANHYMQGAEHVGSDRITGTMYSMGGFPGVRIGSENFNADEPAVVGNLYRIEDDSELPKRLDSYEGYPNLYGRRQVETERGERAWVYEINVPTRETALIASGDWEARYDG